MNLKIGVASLCAAAALPLVASAAEPAGKAEVPRSNVERPNRTVFVPTPVVKWPSVSQARPCDSTACRPVRFAWSPTAPGS